MDKICPFEIEGSWYRGNLHCHTTVSDGILKPEEVVEIYRKNGWDFMAFTEHGIYTDWEELSREDFLIVPGIEVGVGDPRPLRCHHIVGIKGNRSEKGFGHGDRFEGVKWDGLHGAQRLIDELTGNNNLAIYCHPIWSRQEFEDFKDLEGYFAIEIFNYGCELENHTGLSVIYWDSLLRRGRRIWGVATDDAHHRIKDKCGGWITVKARELTHDAIVESLIEGRFYSSTGPEIINYGVVDGEVFVECSPVKAIHFVTYETRGKSFFAEEGQTLISARHKLKGDEKYVRVECVDANGNTAWSNPIFLKG